MHHIKKSFRSKAFRRAAFIFVLAYLSLLATVGMIIYIFINHSNENTLKFGIILAVTLILWILSTIVSASCRCQLCQASSMRSLKCTHHKKAQRLFGSYRLRTSVAILFTSSFRCPYCGEAFSLKPRESQETKTDLPSPRKAQMRRPENIPGKRQ